jgi:hypothetical protein
MTAPLKDRDPIADDAFRVLLDPWPLSDRAHGMIFGFLSAEAAKRGYDTWIEAYHDFQTDAEWRGGEVD